MCLAVVCVEVGFSQMWSQIETMIVRQLISEYFDFALSQLKSQCTKSGAALHESDNLELDLTYLAKVGMRMPHKRHVAFCRCM